MARLAVYLPTLRGGGMERVMLHLAEGFIDAGHDVDVVVSRDEGAFPVPQGSRLITLGTNGALLGRLLAVRASSPRTWFALAHPVLLARRPGRQLRYLASLSAYLREHNPDGLVAAYPYCNLVSVWARRLSATTCRIVLTEHNTTSRKLADKARKGLQWSRLGPLVRETYPLANAVVAVSDGVADDLAATVGLRRNAIVTIYNPVVRPGLDAMASAPASHPWLGCGKRDYDVIVAAGRLTKAKNFTLLLNAFARLRRLRPARLLILGEGEERLRLEARAAELGIASDVALPGFVVNPYAVFARASLFVLSSDWEGLPTVLIEALACGCPVVSTDCPSGPAEILEGGRYGELVPCGDAAALSAAMARALANPFPRDGLRARGKEFSVTRSAERYLELLLPK